MKKNIKYIASLFLGGLIALSACTDSFESDNTNGAGFDDEKKKQDYNYYGIPFGTIQQGIYFNYDWGSGKNWPFQIMQNLGADLFSGYLHAPENFNGGRNNTTYYMMDGWNGSFWENTYGYVLPEVLKAKEINEEGNNQGFIGVAQILKVELMHRVSDMYGPIIYTKFGDKTGSDPDTQQEAYQAFFKDLDGGIEKIEKHLSENDGLNNFSKFDILMPVGKRTYEQWIKFANSLRLRLAIRISMADPTLASAEVRKALSHSAGLLEANDDIVAVATASGYINPLGEIANSWKQTSMNANMESIMGGYEDARLGKYFLPATAIAEGEDVPGVIPYKGTLKGIRQGTGFNHKKYYGCSLSSVVQTTDAVLMTAAEVWFLRAEAALRGWSAESVEQCYESGIRASFAQWGAGNVDAYLESTKQPIDFIDALEPAYNATAVSTITPKWDEAASNEEKLERIITQKWIACYPEGCEGWAEQRRTGYPKLFPVLINESGGTIDTNKGPRRINFPVGIISANPNQYSALTKALGGADNCGTRLWWDTGRNF